MNGYTIPGIHDMQDIVTVSLFGIVCTAGIIAIGWFIAALFSKPKGGRRAAQTTTQTDTDDRTAEARRRLVQHLWHTTMKLLYALLRYSFYAAIALALLAALVGVVLAGYVYSEEIVEQLLRYQWYILLLAVGIALCAAILPPRARRATRKGAWAIVGVVLLLVIATHPFTHAVGNWINRELRAFATELETGYTVYDSFWVTVNKHWTTPIFNPPGKCTYVENADGLRLRGQIKATRNAAWQPYEQGSSWAYLRVRLAEQEPRITGRVFFQIRDAGGCVTPRH